MQICFGNHKQTAPGIIRAKPKHKLIVLYLSVWVRIQFKVIFTEKESISKLNENIISIWSFTFFTLKMIIIYVDVIIF